MDYTIKLTANKVDLMLDDRTPTLGLNIGTQLSKQISVKTAIYTNNDTA